jgi:hypothetical protein
LKGGEMISNQENQKNGRYSLGALLTYLSRSWYFHQSGYLPDEVLIAKVIRAIQNTNMPFEVHQEIHFLKKQLQNHKIHFEDFLTEMIIYLKRLKSSPQYYHYFQNRKD